MCYKMIILLRHITKKPCATLRCFKSCYNSSLHVYRLEAGYALHPYVWNVRVSEVEAEDKRTSSRGGIKENLKYTPYSYILLSSLRVGRGDPLPTLVLQNMYCKLKTVHLYLKYILWKYVHLVLFLAQVCAS